LSAGFPTAIIGGVAGYLTADPDEMVLGTDPTSDAYGANVIDSSADPNMSDMDNHGTYWDRVNEAGRDSMAAVITGQGS
jgi:hypothetical protein